MIKDIVKLTKEEEEEEEVWVARKKLGEHHLDGIDRNGYIACLVSDKSSGLKLMGLSYLIDFIDLDLLSAFFSALGTFSDDELVGVKFKGNYGIWFARGERLEVSLISTRATEENSVNKQKMLNLIEVLETDEIIQKMLDSASGDMRGFSEYVFEILKPFPYYRIDEYYWDLYHPTVEADFTTVRNAIPWCSGSFDALLEYMLPYFNGKRSIEELLAVDAFSEEDVLTIVDVLYHYKFLYLQVKYKPEKLYLQKGKHLFPHKLEEIYGKQYKLVLNTCDGTKNLDQIAKEVKFPLDTLSFLVEKMLLAGALEIVQKQTKEIVENVERRK